MQTATNPQTGETVAYVNGQWVPLPTGGLSFDRLRGTTPRVTPLDDPAIVGAAEDVGLGGQLMRSAVNAAGADTVSGIGGALASIGWDEWGHGLRDWGERNALPPAGTRTISDIEGIGDVPSYVANMLGMAVGSTLPVVGTAAAGAGIGSAVAPGPGTVAGGLGGAALGSYVVNEGQTYWQLYDALRQAGASEEDAHSTAQPLALGLGVPIAALDVFSLSRALPFLRGSVRDLAQEAVEAAAKRGLIGTAGREALTIGGREGLTETAQTGIQEMGEASVNPQYDWSQLGPRLIDSGVAGALGGGAFGVVGAPSARGRARDEVARRADLADVAAARAAAIEARDTQNRVIDAIAGQPLLLPPPSGASTKYPARAAILESLRTAEDNVARTGANAEAFPTRANQIRAENALRRREELRASLAGVDSADIVLPQQEAPGVPGAIIEAQMQERERRAIQAEREMAVAKGAEARAAAAPAPSPMTNADALRIEVESIQRRIRELQAEKRKRPADTAVDTKLTFLTQRLAKAEASLGTNPAGQLAGKVNPIRQPSPESDINTLARETASRIAGNADLWTPIYQDPKDLKSVVGYANRRTGEVRTPAEHLAPIATPLSGRPDVVPTPEEVRQQKATEKAVTDQLETEAAAITDPIAAVAAATEKTAALNAKSGEKAATAAPTETAPVAPPQAAPEALPVEGMDADTNRGERAQPTAGAQVETIGGAPARAVTPSVAPVPDQAAPAPVAATVQAGLPPVAQGATETVAPAIGIPISEQPQGVATPATGSDAGVSLTAPEAGIPATEQSQTVAPVVSNLEPTAGVPNVDVRARPAENVPRETLAPPATAESVVSPAPKPAKPRRTPLMAAMARQEELDRASAKRSAPMMSPSQKVLLERQIHAAAQGRNSAVRNLRPEETALFERWRADAPEKRQSIDELIAPPKPADAKPTKKPAAKPKPDKAMRPDEPGAPQAEGNAERIAKAETDIRAMLKRMTGRDVDFSIVDKPLTIGGQSAVGGFNTQTHAVVVSAFDDSGHAYSPEQITGFARHEAIHWMRENGLFSPEIWIALEKAAPGWRKRFKIDQKWQGDPALLNEEAIAEAYRAWSAGRLKARGLISQAFALIQQVMRSIRRSLGLQGFQSPEQIFRGIARGDFALSPDANPASLGRDSDMLALTIGSTMDDPLPLDIAASWEAALARNYWVLNLAGESKKAQSIGSVLDRSRELIQDRYLPLRRLQEAIERIIGRPLPDAWNAYLAEELMHSKIGDAMLAKDRDIYQPILEMMKQIDRVAGSREQALLDVDRYLVARHAPERNAQIARINKDKDGNPKLDGSGITDAEAAKRVTDLEAKYGQPLKDIQAKVVDMFNRRMELEVAHGLKSREEADRLRTLYPNFVRLNGNEDPDSEGGAQRTERSGRGLMGKRGSLSRRATGRYTEAVDVLAHSLSYFDQTVVRANQNVVRQALLNLAAANPDPDVWAVNKVETKATINPSTGMVQYVRQAEIGPNVVFAHVDGQEYRIALNDETDIGQTMIRTLGHLDGREVNRLLGTMMKLNIVLSKLNTTFNPEFLLTNWIKDVQTAGINLQQFGVDRLARNAAKHLKGALKASYGYQRRKPIDTEWRRWAEKFAQSGGMTYFNDFREPADYIKDINAQLKAGNGGKAQAVWNGVRDVFKWIDQTNNAVDMATRLSVYRAMVESGMSETKAASASKNLTINFNRKGSFGPTLNAFYLFFNASVQGTATLLAAMARSRKVQALTAAVVSAGIAQDLLWSIMSPPDPDDPEKTLYDSIPEYVKQRNMILWVDDDGSYVSLPMPYGYNFFHNLGRLSTRYARGAPVGVGRPASLLDTVRDLGTSFAGAFTPPGFDNILPIPTVAMPIFEVVRNRDFAGRPIRPERRPGDRRPESQMYFPSAPGWSTFAAEKMNQITGGDEYRPGLIDVSPEALQHVVNTFAGASGAFIMRGLGSVGATFGEVTDTNRQDPELGWNDIPYVRRVIGEVGDGRGRDIAYQRMADVELLEDEIAGHQEQGDRAGARELQQQNGPLVALAKEARRLRRSLGEIRTTRQALLDGDTDAAGARARIDALDAREKAMLDQFNERYVRALMRIQARTE